MLRCKTEGCARLWHELESFNTWFDNCYVFNEVFSLSELSPISEWWRLRYLQRRPPVLLSAPLSIEMSFALHIVQWMREFIIRLGRRNLAAVCSKAHRGLTRPLDRRGGILGECRIIVLPMRDGVGCF